MTLADVSRSLKRMGYTLEKPFFVDGKNSEYGSLWWIQAKHDSTATWIKAATAKKRDLARVIHAAVLRYTQEQTQKGE